MSDNLEVGCIHRLLESLFEWKLPNPKLLDQRPESFSPAFNCNGSNWELHLSRHDAGFISFCLLWNEGPACVKVKYQVFCPGKKTILWKSPVVMDHFNTEESEGMKMSLNEEFIGDMQALIDGNLSLCIKFNPDDLLSPVSVFRASLNRRSELTLYENNSKNAVMKVLENLEEGESNATVSEEIINEILGESQNLLPKEKEMVERIFALLDELQQMANDYEKFLASGEGNDMFLEVAAGQKLPVHKAFLMARSKVFFRMLKKDTAEVREGVIRLRYLDPETAKMFLSYIYCGRFPKVVERNIVELHRIADKFDLLTLASNCRGEMGEFLSQENFCEFLTVALNKADGVLTSKCKNFFSENWKHIIYTDKWDMFMDNNSKVGMDLIREYLK